MNRRTIQVAEKLPQTNQKNSHPPRLALSSFLVCAAASAIAALFCLPLPLKAETADSPLERQTAIARYFKIVPIEKSIEETLNQLAAQSPPPQQQAYVRQAMAGMKIDLIRQAAASSLQNRFTAGEINALSDFLETTEGRSAMEKMKLYTADVMPVFQQQLAQAMQGAAAQGPAGYPSGGGGYAPNPYNGGYGSGYQQPSGGYHGGGYNGGGNSGAGQPGGYYPPQGQNQRPLPPPGQGGNPYYGQQQNQYGN